MTIRFHNARILTMNAGEEIYLGELHVTDSRITYVGPSATPLRLLRWRLLSFPPLPVQTPSSTLTVTATS